MGQAWMNTMQAIIARQLQISVRMLKIIHYIV